MRRIPPSILAAALLVVAGACERATEPRPDLTINTMAIRVRGATRLDAVVPAFGAFQHVTTGEGSGVRIAADLEGMPFAIHLPGFPGVGAFGVGRWNPLRDFERDGALVTADPLTFSQNAIHHVARGPSVSFGERPAAMLDVYGSVSGGSVEIDAITIPEARAFSGPKGRIRGRLRTRAAADPLLVRPGQRFVADTIDVSVEFDIELENWRDGRGAARFLDGGMAGRWAPFLIGNGTMWSIGTDPHARLITGLRGILAGSGDVFTIFFGTTLTGPGTAPLAALDPANADRPLAWPEHFVGGYIHAAGGAGERTLASLGGTITLEQYEEHSGSRWGEVKGRLAVDLAVQGGEGLEQTTAEITFHAPVGFSIGFCTPPNTCARDARLSGSRGGVSLETVSPP